MPTMPRCAIRRCALYQVRRIDGEIVCSPSIVPLLAVIARSSTCDVKCRRIWAIKIESSHVSMFLHWIGKTSTTVRYSPRRLNPEGCLRSILYRYQFIWILYFSSSIRKQHRKEQRNSEINEHTDANNNSLQTITLSLLLSLSTTTMLERTRWSKGNWPSAVPLPLP